MMADDFFKFTILFFSDEKIEMYPWQNNPNNEGIFMPHFYNNPFLYFILVKIFEKDS